MTDIDQAVIGDGDAMGISAQVFDDLFRASEWALGIDDPLGFAMLIQPWEECVSGIETFEIPEKGKSARLERILQPTEKGVAEITRQNADG